MSYNQYDSYPEGLGIAVVQQVQDILGMFNIEELKDEVREIVLVDENMPATQEIYQATETFHNLSVGSQSQSDPYCLFREMQGNLIAPLQIHLMLDSSDFIRDSVFCEYGYIVNLDTEALEVWKGFQRAPDRYNRYGCHPNSGGYYPCKLVATFDLCNINEVSFTKILQEKGIQ